MESQDTDVPMGGETENKSPTSPNAQVWLKCGRSLDYKPKIDKFQVHVIQSFGPQVTPSQESAPVDTTGPKLPTGAMPIPEAVLSSGKC